MPECQALAAHAEELVALGRCSSQLTTYSRAPETVLKACRRIGVSALAGALAPSSRFCGVSLF